MKQATPQPAARASPLSPEEDLTLACHVTGEAQSRKVPPELTPDQFHLLLSSLRERVYLLDHSWRFAYANEVTCSFLGMARNHLLGRSLWEVVPDFRKMPFFKTFFRAMKTRTPATCECEYLGIRGHLECCEISVYPTSEGLFCIGRNVAKRNRAERVRTRQRLLRHQEWLQRDLHDGLGGILSKIGMITAGCALTPPAGWHTALASISDLAREASAEIRAMMNTLGNTELPWPDLLAQIRHHGEMLTHQSPVEFELRTEGKFPAGTKGRLALAAGMSLFRVCREALHNAVRHAHARRVVLEARFERTSMHLVISDDGQGFPPATEAGRGIANMRKRIEELNGRFSIAGHAGVTVEAHLPLPLPSLEAAENGGKT